MYTVPDTSKLDVVPFPILRCCCNGGLACDQLQSIPIFIYDIHAADAVMRVAGVTVPASLPKFIATFCFSDPWAPVTASRKAMSLTMQHTV